MRGRDQRADLRLRVERVADASVAAPARRTSRRSRRRSTARRARASAPRSSARRSSRSTTPSSGSASSRFASAKTRFGLLPPSSSVMRLIGPDARRMISPPVCRRAGERDLVDARMTNEIRARRLARTGDDVDRAGREADLGRELGQPERGQRRRLVRLQHDGAARRQARAQASTSPSSAGSSTGRSGRRRRRAPSASRRAASRRS